MIERKCKFCRVHIVLVRKSSAYGWAVLLPEPVPEHLQDANRHLVVVDGRAWKPRELADQIAMRREVTPVEGMNIARDEWTWHEIHRCTRGGDGS